MLEGPIKAQYAGAEVLKTTPLELFHKSLDARMISFAGYLMPLQYPPGIISEHNHTRNSASLFDISHMGQIYISGKNVSETLESLVPANIANLSIGRMRYTMLTNDEGGILDDIIVIRQKDGFRLVVNASSFETDLMHIRSRINGDIKIDILNDHALLALQGPDAAAMLDILAHNVIDMPFMSAREVKIQGIDTLVSRCGYTGEDGFEISVPVDSAKALAKQILNLNGVELAGLGARDTLRLEAGLCLYGQDIDTTTTPIEAGLAWTITQQRREKGIFPGANIIRQQLIKGTSKRLVGILPSGRAPARAGTQISSQNGKLIGTITSGGFGPTIGGPVAMGYVATPQAKLNTSVTLDIRGKPTPAIVTKLPFIQHRYYRTKRAAPGET